LLPAWHTLLAHAGQARRGPPGEIYIRFSEGFDTGDLEDAEELLDELAA